MDTTYAIILAGGSGTRLQSELPKAFVQVNGLTIIEHTIKPFESCTAIDHIILVVPEVYMALCQSWQTTYSKIAKVVAGGATRYHSSCIGLAEVPNKEYKVLIHDAARPFIDEQCIVNCVKALDTYDAVTLLSPVSNSLVRIKEGKIVAAVNRDDYRQVLTPQAFKKSCLAKAHSLASKLPLNSITDDFNLVMMFDTGSTSWIEGNTNNIKITYPYDLKLAQYLL